MRELQLGTKRDSREAAPLSRWAELSFRAKPSCPCQTLLPTSGASWVGLLMAQPLTELPQDSTKAVSYSTTH